MLFNIVNHHLIYKITSYFYYSILVFVTYLSFEEGRNPVLPNPIHLTLSFLVLFFSYQGSQILEPTDVARKTILTRLLMTPIPFILGSYSSFKLAKNIQKRKGEFAFWLNFYILSLIFGILAFSFFLILLLIQMNSTPTQAGYMLTIGMWFYLPIALVDSNKLYMANLDQIDLKNNTQLNVLKLKLQKAITKLYFTEERRLIVYFIIFLLFGFNLLLNSKYELRPISV